MMCRCRLSHVAHCCYRSGAGCVWCVRVWQWENVVEEKALSVSAITKERNKLAEDLESVKSANAALNKQVEMFSEQVRGAVTQRPTFFLSDAVSCLVGK